MIGKRSCRIAVDARDLVRVLEALQPGFIGIGFRDTESRSENDEGILTDQILEHDRFGIRGDKTKIGRFFQLVVVPGTRGDIGLSGKIHRFGILEHLIEDRCNLCPVYNTVGSQASICHPHDISVIECTDHGFFCPVSLDILMLGFGIDKGHQRTAEDKSEDKRYYLSVFHFFLISNPFLQRSFSLNNILTGS